MTSKLRRLHRFRKLDVFAGNLVDGCAAGAPAHSRKAGGEGFLIATAKQEDREACVPDHGGKRLIEDAVAGELASVGDRGMLAGEVADALPRAIASLR